MNGGLSSGGLLSIAMPSPAMLLTRLSANFSSKRRLAFPKNRTSSLQKEL